MPPAYDRIELEWVAPTQSSEAMDAYLVTEQLANFGRAGVGNGNNLDLLSILDVLDLLRLEDGLEGNAPVRAEPEKGLDGDDGANPDKSPFRRADVLLVELRAEKVTNEDGPDDGKGPDVGMEVQRQRAQQLRLLDLRVVDERRHGRDRGRYRPADEALGDSRRQSASRETIAQFRAVGDVKGA